MQIWCLINLLTCTYDGIHPERDEPASTNKFTAFVMETTRAQWHCVSSLESHTPNPLPIVYSRRRAVWREVQGCCPRTRWRGKEKVSLIFTYKTLTSIFFVLILRTSCIRILRGTCSRDPRAAETVVHICLDIVTVTVEVVIV